MTAQISEELTYKGKSYFMCANPLCDYFGMGGEDPGFEGCCSACWRGYVGTWEIIEDRLYMTGIDGYLVSGKEASLEDVFPGYPDRVFAHWYSGTLRCPQGECIEYVHMGYASKYQADLLIHVERGCVTGSELIRNAGNFDEDAANTEYALAGFTTFPASGSQKLHENKEASHE